MALGTAHAGFALKPVGEGAAQVSGEDFAVGKLNHAPSVVAVAVLSQVAIDGLLTHGNNPVDLLFGVGEALLDIQVVSANINLCSC